MLGRRVLRLTLKTAHVGAVNPCLISQFLLRNTAIHADPTHIPGHKRTSFHALKHVIRQGHQTTGYTQWITRDIGWSFGKSRISKR